MDRGPLVGLLVTELSATVALPLGYGVAGGTCAPPEMACFMRDVGCIAVCTDAWSQFPTVAAVGAALGAIPAVLVALLIWRTRRRGDAPSSTRLPIGLPALGSLGTIALAAVVFPYMGASMLAAILGFGLGTSLALSGAYALARKLVSRRSDGGPR